CGSKYTRSIDAVTLVSTERVYFEPHAPILVHIKLLNAGAEILALISPRDFAVANRADLALRAYHVDRAIFADHRKLGATQVGKREIPFHLWVPRAKQADR